MTSLRDLPSVEQLLQTRSAAELIAQFGRPLTLNAVRHVLDMVRKQGGKSGESTLPGREGLLNMTAEMLDNWTHPTLQPVINAPGVILHTTLGRAPLAQTAITAMDVASRDYSSLEFDLASGKRGSRSIHAESLLQQLTGAQAALVVNNNAAAVLLVLSALANRKRVVIARSQLVEIGGGFRVPEVMTQSGAKLVEVGTTNKVRISDYETALLEPAALVMHVQPSNFKIIGFTEEPELKEIVQVAHNAQVLCVDDAGSGVLLDTAKFGLPHEPTIQESLAAGMDIVCFSGDKLLGGPQAGIIVGRQDLLTKIKKHPLARALRVDKTRLAGLIATLLHYLKDQAEREIPIWRMMALTPGAIRQTAKGWARTLGEGEVLPSLSTIGGGSLPGETLPTFVLALDVKNTDKFMEKLRAGQPAVIARIENKRILLDPRTVLPEQEGALLVTLMNTLKKPAGRARG
jgi:L-seryl-tRNA(Ser) seleniumtransferase